MKITSFGYDLSVDTFLVCDVHSFDYQSITENFRHLKNVRPCLLVLNLCQIFAEINRPESNSVIDFYVSINLESFANV